KIGQVKTATETALSTRTYNHDAGGNRTSKSAGTTTTYATANNVNEIASATGADAFTSATYDHNGNLTQMVYPDGSRRKLTWYSSNRVKYFDVQAGATLASGDKRVYFVYGGNGQRRQMSTSTWNGSIWTSTVNEYFLWADGEIIQKRVDSTSSNTRTHYYAEGETRHTGTGT